MSSLTFITGNPAKAKHLSDYLDFPVDHIKLDLPEIQSLNLMKVVSDKAERAYAQIWTPVLVEDTSFALEWMNGLPGPLIKWFFESIGNEGICRLADTFKDRHAKAEVAFAYFDGDEMHTFTGAQEGKIADKPRGESNFGTDPIFIPDGYELTWAEMSKADQDATSMRRLALEKLTEFLRSRA